MASTSSRTRHQLRNWLDLPSDVMANILSRVGMVDILENVDKVCTAWHKICMDPAMWRVVNINGSHTTNKLLPLLKKAAGRSKGQLVDITISYAYNDARILRHAAKRLNQLKRLEVIYDYSSIGSLSKALMKFPLLEELNLYFSRISKKEIETLGHYCPMLKTLKVNHNDASLKKCNEIAIAIGHNLHGLRHLELIGNNTTNIGLQAIMDNCLHLQTLDLRECFNIDMKGELGQKCSKQIKHLKLPDDSLEGYPYSYRSYLVEEDDDYLVEEDDDWCIACDISEWCNFD